jgi:uncharacterized membrane protein YkoI
MKLNRFTALAVIALLVIAAMGLASTRSAARTQSTANQQAQTTSLAPAQAPASEDPSTGPDTDTVEEQAGEQVEDGRADGAEGPEVAGADDAGPDQQTPAYTGSIFVDPATAEGMSETDEAAALAGQAKISTDQAKAAALAANPGTTVVKVEIDNDNGVLVYSVELNNGSEVKVDAGNGTILHTETGADNEG